MILAEEVGSKGLCCKNDTTFTHRVYFSTHQRQVTQHEALKKVGAIMLLSVLHSISYLFYLALLEWHLLILVHLLLKDHPE
jgi:hypothetical protein